MILGSVAARCRLDALVTRLLAYPGDVGLVDLVPCRHVLVHAGSHAGRLAAGQGGAGFGNALLETVFLEFLYAHGHVSKRVSLRKEEQRL